MQAKIANDGMKHDIDLLKASHAERELPGGFWYLATPYSKYEGGLALAFAHACQGAAKLIERGLAVYSPITHSHPIAFVGGLDPRDYKIWMPLNEPMMESACGVLVLEMPGWEQSVGVIEEIKNFRAQGKPVKQVTWPDCAVLEAGHG